MTEELLPFCECGECGLRVTKPGNRFIKGHNRRGIPHTPETCAKMSKPKSISHRAALSEAGKHAAHSPTRNDALSKAGKKRYENPKEHEKTSNATKKRYEDPEERKKTSNAGKKRFKDPEEREKISIILKNSDAVKARSERQRGGNDIVTHHHIYDHNDLSKYTIEMTRSQHTSLHRNMQTLGLKVPHINTGHENEEELQLMKYIKKIEE